MQLLDRKEDLKDSLRQWEYGKKKRTAKKAIQAEEVENPNQASLQFDSEIDCTIPPPKSIKEMVDELTEVVSKELEKNPNDGWLKGLFKMFRG
jgi:hypothetical protein